MRIAHLADINTSGAWYRSFGPMAGLSARGFDLRPLLADDGVFRPERLTGCDLLHIHRHHDSHALRLVRFARDNEIPVIWDNDDDLSAIPRNAAAYRRYGGARGAREIAQLRRIVSIADLVTTPSEHLAEKFREYGAQRVEVIENYVRDEAVGAKGRPRGSGDNVIVGWMAGKEHHLDVERIPIKGALTQLLDAHAEVEAVTIGVGLGLSHDRYHHFDGVEFDALRSVVAQLDIGIAPLADIPLNHARSNIKLKEYAVAGVPWLASPVGPYASLGEEEGGHLVADDNWFAALDALIRDRRRHRKLSRRAWRWGRSQVISAHIKEWEDRFKAVSSGTASA